MLTGSAVASPVTVHFTRIAAPPPVPDPLHWVTVALVVLATGSHTTVGWVPPPVPDPMHSLTVAPDVGVPLATLLENVTLQITLLPPPVTMPLHWLIEETSWFDVVTVVVQPAGGSTPAAAKHAVAVIVELVAPAEVTVLVIAMLHDACSPAPVGKAGGLHWAAAGAEAAAEATGAQVMPISASEPRAVTAATTATSKCRMPSDLVRTGSDGAVVRLRLGPAEPRRELREQCDDVKADNMVGPPPEFPEIHNTSETDVRGTPHSTLDPRN